MLHRIEIENFYSIRDRMVIDLQHNARDQDGVLSPIASDTNRFSPKVVALFGPNASGKTNILRAISLAAWFVRDSISLGPEIPLPFWRFNSDVTSDAPTTLVLHVAGLEDFRQTDNPEARTVPYRYELTIAGGRARNEVEREALYFTPSWSSRPVRLFERNKWCKVKTGKEFKVGLNPNLESVIRPNASVVSTFAQFNHAFSQSIRLAAQNLVSNVLLERGEIPDKEIAQHYALHPDQVELFNREIERLDVGVRRMVVWPNGPEGPVLAFEHHGMDRPLVMFNQSSGTRQFVKFFPSLIGVLATGGVAAMDELDSMLHPTLLAEIVGWFRSRERNPLNAQLWMSCQDATLLDVLSKNEVVLVQKDRTGCTDAYRLRDIKNVRRDENLSKKYLGGVYGAIPEVG